ncbi:MAG: hypothetical protein ACLT9Y_03550 [Peptostreptococcus anaerobius]
MAIKNTGADIILWASVLPGAMFLLAYYGKNGSDKTIPILSFRMRNAAKRTMVTYTTKGYGR